jgi:demethylmenaquinone methyltransferase/2-methoxy-6-polyprenyl-1,4-benzoquinol methylase
MTEDREYIKSFFREHARIYDIASMPLAGVRKKAASMVKERDGAKVLDVATGTGKQAFAFARKGYQVTGIDLSEEMLEIARRKNKYRNLKLESGDATNLPYDSNHFDITCISYALHDMPASFRGKVLAEMVRVTRSGGTIMVIDYVLPRWLIIRKIAYAFINSFESKYYPDFIKNDLPALMEKAGIRIEEERGVLWGTGRIYKGTKAG